MSEVFMQWNSLLNLFKNYALLVSTSLKNTEKHPYPLLGRLIGRVALPAQLLSQKLRLRLDLERALFEQEQEKENYQVNFITVPSTRQATLDTMIFSPNSIAHIPEAERLHILYCMGNRNFYEFYRNTFLDTAQKSQATVISFNYRNVGRSKGIPIHERDLINDVKAQIKRLLQKGVPANKIVLNGHSLGGGLATVAVAEAHEKKQDCHLYNDRSYSTLIDAGIQMFIGTRVTGIFGLCLGAVLAYAFSLPLLASIGTALLCAASSLAIYHLQPQFFQTMLRPIFYLVMGKSGWYIDAEQAYQKIPAHYRKHTIIQSPKNPKRNAQQEPIPMQCQDTVMKKASLEFAIKIKRQHFKKQSKDPQTPEDVRLNAAALYQSLKPIKLVSPERGPYRNLHNVSNDQLIERHSGKNAQQYFTEVFVQECVLKNITSCSFSNTT